MRSVMMLSVSETWKTPRFPTAAAPPVDRRDAAVHVSVATGLTIPVVELADCGGRRVPRRTSIVRDTQA